VRRIAEEANYFDAVLDSMNQVQNGLESLLAEINGFDAFDSQVERVDQELAVSDTSILTLLSFFVSIHGFVHHRRQEKKLTLRFRIALSFLQFMPLM
jgi:hypothetical protein